jgi:hypothetical protein
VDPITPRSNRRRRRVLRALAGLAAFLVVVPLAAIELAYQIEIARIPERPPSPAPSFPPLLARSLAVQLFDTPDPEMTPTYPWTPLVAVVRMRLGAKPRLTPEALAARQVLRTGQVHRRQIWSTIDEAVLAIWISRHLSAPEAISVALSKMPFGLETSGVESAARRFFGKSAADLDAGEIAELLAVSTAPDFRLRHREGLRGARDSLLSKLQAHGVIDEPTTMAAMQRDVRRIK